MHPKNNLSRYSNRELQINPSSCLPDIFFALKKAGDAAIGKEYEFARAQYRISLRLINDLSVPALKAGIAGLGVTQSDPFPDIQEEFKKCFDQVLKQLPRSDAWNVVKDTMQFCSGEFMLAHKNNAPVSDSLRAFSREVMTKTKELMPGPVGYLIRGIDKLERHFHSQP